jgi:hypothetical protein
MIASIRPQKAVPGGCSGTGKKESRLPKRALLALVQIVSQRSKRSAEAPRVCFFSTWSGCPGAPGQGHLRPGIPSARSWGL